MFIFTAKLSKRKLAVAVVGVGLLLCAIIVLLTRGSSPANTSAAASGHPSGKNIQTGDDRINFLKEYGWDADEQPVEFEEVLIPAEFDDVFNEYNNLQKTQGYDLTKYKGKRAMRYSYNITNYPNVNENVRANLLIYKNTVIAGDICSVNLDGFIHGLEKP